MAYHLLQHDRAGAQALAQALGEALRAIRHCARCNNFTEEEICTLCRSSRRDAALLCVVETPADLAMIEQTLGYSGMYFVLMGRLSPLDGVGPRDIGLDRLLARATDGVVQEVILATNFTNEGEATAHYIAEMLRAAGSWRRASRAACRSAANSNMWTSEPFRRRCSTGAGYSQPTGGRK